MVENSKNPVRIDLNEFKLHIHLKKIQLTLHFNSPSRRFYLSVIALVVNEMKRLGRITSIPLEGHFGLLVLLNETIGGSAGSSDRENLLPRIYRKWKDALPDLEDAPLFKVLGRRKEYNEGVGRAYPFAETEKDSWANLFEYQGSEENVRLKFAIDKLGATLDDIAIIYQDSLNGDAWKRFISSLKEKVEVSPDNVVKSHGTLARAEAGVRTPPLPNQETVEESDSHSYENNDHGPNQTFSETAEPEKENADEVHQEPVAPVSPQTKGRIMWPSGYRRVWLIAAVVAVVGLGTLATWRLFLKPAPVKKASIERTGFLLPDKPSIAVLPFVNMSNDPEQEFFSDGLTEEIITTLSKSPNLFVTARTSTFAYKGKPIRVDQVAVELRVRYVLEGSVRRASDQIRISAQLIDATTGNHLWAERYDGTMKDVFAIQDEIASKIMKILQVKLGAGPFPSETRGGSKNAEAYLKSVEATEQLLRSVRPGIARAQQLFEEVIVLEPDFSRGYSGLALSYGMGTRAGMSKSPKESLARAIDLAKKALSLNETDAINHAALAYLLSLTGQHDKAVARAERALALDANSFPVLNFSGLAYMYSCKGKEAIAVIERAEQLNPSFPFSSVHLSWAYRFEGRYEEAFNQAQRAVKRNPKSLYAQLALTATSNLSGREAEARSAAKEVLKLSPNFSLEWVQNDNAFKDKSQIDLTVDALRKADLK